MKKPIKIGILGLGRIGQLHTRNISNMPEYEIVAGVDAYLTDEKKKKAAELGVPYVSTEPDDIFLNSDIEAVAICSTTETHSEYIIRAAQQGKAAFCEKPIDNNVERIIEALKIVKDKNTILQIGFSRRFDKHHNRLQKMVSSGKIGKANLLKITSRDPAPPTYDYVASSGGIYVDMMIHDFDMARFIMRSEVTEVYATGSVLCDSLFEKAKDVDTAVVTLKHENGELTVIDNSRSSGFGHDQRLEVLGSQGCLMDQNQTDTNVLYLDGSGIHSEPVQYFFLERYNDAFIEELRQFAKVIRYGQEIPATGMDGLQAVLIAEAAAKSAISKTAEKVEKITI